MDIHRNARLTPHGRAWIVRQVARGQTPKAVAQADGVCPRMVRKWVDRYRAEGPASLRDRSSRPHRLRRPTPPAIVAWVDQQTWMQLRKRLDGRRRGRVLRALFCRDPHAYLSQLERLILQPTLPQYFLRQSRGRRGRGG